MKNLKLNLLEKKEMNEVRGGQSGSGVHWCKTCPCSKCHQHAGYAFNDVNERKTAR